MTKRGEEKGQEYKFLQALKSVAPGTVLRDGLENILRAKTGALIVVGDLPEVMTLVHGGFAMNTELTPANIYELAKMDGAIVLSKDGRKILYANAQLMPDPSIETSETGTRHRTAERMARQTGELVLSISQRRNVITLYQGSTRYTLKDINVILNRANAAVQTVEKYHSALNQSLVNLGALEFEDLVTLYDVSAVLQRAERVNRIIREVERYVLELGTEGRLISMQMEELTGNLEERFLLLKDYYTTNDYKAHIAADEQLSDMGEDLLDSLAMCRVLGYPGNINALDMPVVPRGYRLLRKIPRLPMSVIENLVLKYRNIHHVLSATVEDLDEVEGIGEVRARSIKDGLRRIREQVLLGRHI